MRNSGYGKFLGIFLIIIIIAIVGILGYVLYGYYSKWRIAKETSKVIDEFKNNIKNVNNQIIDINLDTNIEPTEIINTPEEPTYYAPIQYYGVDVIGLIEIPVIGLEYPILSSASVSALNTSVGYLYGPRIK